MTFNYNEQYFIRGIVSTGPVIKKDSEVICDLSQYVVFVDVAQYLPWIDKNTNKCGNEVQCSRIYLTISIYTNSRQSNP